MSFPHKSKADLVDMGLKRFVESKKYAPSHFPPSHPLHSRMRIAHRLGSYMRPLGAARPFLRCMPGLFASLAHPNSPNASCALMLTINRTGELLP